MIEKAIEKIQSEIDENKNNPYVHVVGGFLINHLDKSPQDAEKIMAQDKTLIKSLDEMRNAASKKKVGNCAVLTDQEAFSIVFKYYGIESAVTIPVPATAVTRNTITVTTPKPKSKMVDFDVNLDDFI